VRRRLAVAGAVAHVLLTGCVLQGGARAGRAFSTSQVDHDHVSWAGGVASAVEVAHIHGGLELEGRSEQQGGSQFTTGLQLGASTGTETSRFALILHGDIGIPIAWGSRDGFYTGATLQMPVLLEEPLPIADRNRSLRLLGGSILLTPFVRYRYYDLDVEGPERERFHDLSGGIAVGIRYGTDLL
jgi:hypothetical protein